MKERNTTKIERTKFELEKNQKLKILNWRIRTNMHLGFGVYAPENEMGNRSMKLHQQNGRNEIKGEMGEMG